MAQIAGLTDFRKQGPPADVGTFQMATTALVFQFTFSGTTYIVAIASGIDGWVLIDQGLVASTVIQSAIDYVFGLGGGDTRIEQGTYAITISLNPRNLVNIYGSGWDTLLDTGANDISCIEFAGASELVIRDLYIKQNKTETATSCGIRTTSGPNSHVKIINLKIEDANHRGMAVGVADHWDIVGCYVLDAFNHGIDLLSANTHEIRVQDCDVDTVGDTGINLWGISEVLVENCEVINCTNDGIAADFSQHVQIVDNHISDCTSAAILVSDENTGNIRDILIEGNILESCGHQGVEAYIQGNYYMEYISIVNNIIRNCSRHGVSIGAADESYLNHNLVEGNIIENNSYEGVLMEGNKSAIVGNILIGNGADGQIRFNNATGCICASNTISDPTGVTCSGIKLVASIRILIDGNMIYDATDRGIYGDAASEQTLCTDNWIYSPADRGIELLGDDPTTISDNVILDAGADGIYCNTCAVISGNFIHNPAADGITPGGAYQLIEGNHIYSAGAQGIDLYEADTIIISNIIRGSTNNGIDFANEFADRAVIHNNIITDNGAFGVNIVAGNSDCSVLYNVFRNNTSGHINDAGTDTLLATIPLYIAQYNTNTTHEDGVEIDEGGEWASFVGQLPLHVQQVVRWEIWAVGLADPGPDNQMCLEIDIQGGASHEPKTQHDTGVLAGQLSEEIDSSVDDIIHWVCISANALLLLGGDSVKCVVRHNVAVASDIATDAAFRRVLVEYV